MCRWFGDERSDESATGGIAIALLQNDKRGDYRDGVQVDRQIFAFLPENNRIVKP